jgi:photosystem II stability/assembly factor-like uncharacterized protein
MIAYVATGAGTYAVDLETEEVEAVDVEVEAGPQLALNLPRVVASASFGSTVVAVVDAKPPLLVSHDAGSTWTAAGRGLPSGFAIAIAAGDPDTVLFAARNRLYLSRNGGVFWTALRIELPQIVAIEIAN